MSGMLSKAFAMVRVRSPKVAGTLRVPSLSAAGVPTSERAWATFTRKTTADHQGGYGTQSVPATNRRGVTLVELLVVILIMLLITAITVPVLAPSMKNRDVREAARMIDVFINGARTRALQSGHPFGVMLEREPNNPNACTTISYCEQPDPYSGDYQQSSIRLLGNGGFGAWDPMANPNAITSPSIDPVFPMGDIGWPQSVAPGDIMVIKGTQYRLWAGEPFIDLNQDGVHNPPYQPGDPSPYAKNNIQEPFADVDGSGAWTPPDPATIDPATGYFTTIPTPPQWGQPSASITYMYADPVLAAKTMTSTGVTNPIRFAPQSVTVYTVDVMTMMPVKVPNKAASYPFSILRRPLKTSAPSLQLPGGAAIDLGSNYPDQQFSIIVPVPGSGMEVLVQDQNNSGWWSTFRANPLLDPALNGLVGPVQNPAPSDPTSIMITFLPSGTVDKVYSWSEANDVNATGGGVNWTDWQGRIPASPIYLLVGRPELINGDPDLVGRIGTPQPPYDPVTKTGGPIYNVQDPNSLWVVINPRTGSVATAENVGYDLTQPIPANAAVSGQNAMQMQIYWAANVYYARRLARAMLDMGGR
jgi:prepilin-type N-terminal cleavage/methylation domain-containing protein